MSRPTPKSVTALFLTLLFLLTTAGESWSASACPHHELTALAEAAEGSGTSESPHHHAATDIGAPGSHRHDAAPCTCVGGCLPGAAGVLPLPRVAPELAAAPLTAVVAATPPAARPRVHLLPYVLPFAQAPPAA